MSVQAQMLEALLTKAVVPRATLLAFNPGKYKDYGLRTIKEITEKGYARKIELNANEEKDKKIIEYYCITPTGIRFLKDLAIRDDKTEYESRKVTEIPWLKYIDSEDTKGVAILSDLPWGNFRIMTVGEAATLSKLAGATVPVFVHEIASTISDVSERTLSAEEIYFSQKRIDEVVLSEQRISLIKLDEERRKARKADPNIKTSKTLKELMMNAMKKWYEDETGKDDLSYYRIINSFNYTKDKMLTEYPTENEDYIRFIHPQVIKHIVLAGITTDAKDVHDTDRCRFSGILQSRVRTLLLYPTHKKTLPWPSQISRAELAADSKWKDNLKPEFKSAIAEGACGALLVKSPAKFRKLWRNPRKSFRTQTEIGALLKHLYLIENINVGAKELRDIMLTDTATHMREETERILSEGFGESAGIKFERNTGAYSDLFPVTALIDDNTYLFAVGTWVDVRQIEEIIMLSDSTLDKSYGLGVVCEKWQHEYYKIMYPIMVTYWNGKTRDEIEDDDYQ